MIRVMDGARYRKCKRCGLLWNVPAIGTSPKTYICPRCEKKKSEKERGVGGGNAEKGG